MHKLAPSASRPARAARAHLSATHAVRPARPGDVNGIHALVRRYATQGVLLPRTRGDIAAAIDDYIVVVDAQHRVRACAALACYGAGLAEVGAVAVAPTARGGGLGTMAVRGVEALARDRGIGELFAMTKAEAFFEALGYERSTVTQYPEKLARYEALRAAGVQVVERACYRKLMAAARPASARPRRPARHPRATRRAG